MRRVSSQKKHHKKKLEDENKIYSQHILQRLSFEKSKKILVESGISLNDDEIKEAMELVHKLADLIIKEHILK